MLGTRAAGELTRCSRGTAGRTLGITARSARGPVAIKDRSAALNAACGDTGVGLGRGHNHGRRSVDRTGASLRHHHAASRKGGGGGWRVGMSFGAVRGLSHWFGDNFGTGLIARGGNLLLGSGVCCLDLGRRRSFCSRRGFRDRGRSDGSFRCRKSGGSGDLRRGNWRRGRRLGCRRRRGGARVSFANGMGGGRASRGLDYHACSRRRYDNGWPHCSRRTCRSFGHDWAGWRTAGDGRRRRNDLRRSARQGNNLARLRASGCSRRRRGGHHGRSRFCRSLRDCRRRGGGSLGRMAAARFGFIFLFLSQNRLQHIAGFGDMREINFGRYALRGARLLRS